MIALGDDAGARDVLTEAVDLFTRRGQRGQIPEVQARLARALVHLGDIGAARKHAEAAAAVATASDIESRFISAVARAEVLEAEGDVHAADGLFREAIAIVEPSGMGSALAETREHYGTLPSAEWADGGKRAPLSTTSARSGQTGSPNATANGSTRCSPAAGRPRTMSI